MKKFGFTSKIIDDYHDFVSECVSVPKKINNQFWVVAPLLGLQLLRLSARLQATNNLLPLLSRLKLGKSSCSDNTIPVLVRPCLRGLRGTHDRWHCPPLIIRFTPIAVIDPVLAIILVFKLLESLLPVSSSRDLCVWG